MKLKDLEHLRSDRRIRFSKEVVNGEELTIVCYMVGENDLWTQPLATECRGIVFNSNGDCVCRPFHKFFNVGENEFTQVANVSKMSLEVLEKRDGSMLTPVLVGGEIFWKTKKSFVSEVAVEAATNVPENVKAFSVWLLERNLTPIFEYTSPFNKVVLNYGNDPKFVLLAVRHNTTGQYQNHNTLAVWADCFNVEVIQKFDLTLQECLQQVETLENFEGWCLRDVETGFYVKVKTSWYLRNHRAQTELRVRDVADMVIDETLDDIKAALTLDGFDLTPIETIEHDVVSQLSYLRETTESLVESVKDKSDFKVIANTFKDHAYFGLIMTSVRGKEPDYKKFWKSNFRENYSLKCIYNENF